MTNEYGFEIPLVSEEEYFRKNYPDSCYGDKPLSPYWDFFQEGVEFGERQSEKKIEELEKENAELKEEMKAKQVVLNDFKSRVETVTDRFNKKSSQLTKANLLLEDVYKIAMEDWNDPKWHDQVLRKTREYLKEIEEC